MSQTTPTIILTDYAETDIQLIEIPQLKPGSALRLDCRVHVWLKRGTSLTLCLYRGSGPSRVLLDTHTAPAPRAAYQYEARQVTLDVNPPRDMLYTLTAIKTGRWAVGCTPHPPRWHELAR